MKEQKFDLSKIERSILIGMITNDKFIKGIQPIYKNHFFQTDFTRLISTWCQEYYQKHNSAPGKHIQDIYNFRKDDLEESLSDVISLFLSSISDEYDRDGEINTDFLLQETEKYFESNQLNELGAKILAASTTGNVDDAQALLLKYQSVKIPASDGFNPFTDIRKIRESFEEKSEPLFKFPGAFGRLINSELVRDSLIGVMGREKIGKSWILQEFAFRAVRHRCRVALFQLGDLSEKQQTRRLHIRLAGKSNKRRYCGELLQPILDCKHNQDSSCKSNNRADGICIDWKLLKDMKLEQFFKEHEEHEPCDYCKKNWNFDGAIWYRKEKITSPLTWKEGFLLGKKLKRYVGENRFRLSCHLSDSLKVLDIEIILNRWKDRDNFIPDVIVIDYADILAAEDGRKEMRLQQDQTWKKLRALSLERNCLIITATQTKSESYKKEVKSIGLEHFSESKNKYAHVTCFLGLNQSSEEKKRGILRIGKILARDEEFNPDQEVNILQCLKRGRPFLDSF